jgi:hypothetical protein
MNPVLNFAVIADAHTQGGDLKHLPRLVDAIAALPKPPDFVVSLGDSVYGLRENDVLADAQAYHEQIQRLPCPHFHVIGNHEAEPVEEFGQLMWAQLLAAWQMPGRWYSFDCRGVHCVVLDSWLALTEPRHASTLAQQAAWLREDLARSDGPVFVFSHEGIGFEQSDLEEWVQTDNRWFWPAPNVLESILEEHASRIVGVFEGHKHKCLWKQRGGITYHLIAPAYQHGGQFAQVFVGAGGEWRVQAHPDGGAAEDSSRQVTYSSERWAGPMIVEAKL